MPLNNNKSVLNNLNINMNCNNNKCGGKRKRSDKEENDDSDDNKTEGNDSDVAIIEPHLETTSFHKYIQTYIQIYLQ